MSAGPVDMLVFTDLQEQIELLCKKRVVVAQLQAKEGKGLDERTAADDYLRPALRKQIEGSKSSEIPVPGRLSSELLRHW